MFKRLLFAFVLISFFQVESVAQRNVRDSSIFMPLVSVDYTALFPGADYYKRFGYTNSIGLTVDFKMKSNWIFGLHGNFLFGGSVKDVSQFEEIINSDLTVTSLTGGLAAVALKMRGFNVNADFGYLFTFKKPNPNSGVFVKMGLGYLQHNIYIQNVEEDVPQLNGDYKKGYDRMSMGVNFNQHIGYQFISSRGFWNVHIGFYFMEGLTQNIRYNYDTKSKSNKLQFDLLYGIKAGWIIPIYKRTPDKVYYN